MCTKPLLTGGVPDDEKRPFPNELCKCVWIVGGGGWEPRSPNAECKPRGRPWLFSVRVPSPLCALLATHAARKQVNVPHTGLCISKSFQVSLLGHDVGACLWGDALQDPQDMKTAGSSPLCLAGSLPWRQAESPMERIRLFFILSPSHRGPCSEMTCGWMGQNGPFRLPRVSWGNA